MSTSNEQTHRILLHPGQSALWRIADRSKVTVGILGRRWGKTFFGVAYAFDRMTRAVRQARDVVWVAPYYDLGKIAWDEFHRLFMPVIARSNEGGHWVRLFNGSRMFWRSADNPVSIRGRGYDLAMVDEATQIPKTTFEAALLPTLADRNGDMVIFTSPGGRRGFVFEEFQRAVHGEPGYGFYQGPTAEWADYAGDDPEFKTRAVAVLETINRLRPTMTEADFAREFEAQFQEDGTSLFTNLDLCTGGNLTPPEAGAPYVIGVDLAKTTAWTVVTVMRLGLHPTQVVHQDRFHKIRWQDQAARAAKIAKAYNNAPAVVDATQVGDPVVEMMEDAGMTVRPFVFTEKSRKELLDSLAIAFGDCALRIPRALMKGPLGEELAAMVVDTDDQARVKYTSRARFTDCVMALALAWQGVPAPGAAGMRIGTLDEDDRTFLDTKF